MWYIHNSLDQYIWIARVVYFMQALFEVFGANVPVRIGYGTAQEDRKCPIWDPVIAITTEEGKSRPSLGIPPIVIMGYCDYGWNIKAGTGFGLLGGYCRNDVYDGVLYVGLRNSESTPDWTIGAKSPIGIVYTINQGTRKCTVLIPLQSSPPNRPKAGMTFRFHPLSQFGVY